MASPSGAGEPGAKLAKLKYRVIRSLEDDGTLIELSPETGRMHQLRVQAASRGWPIRGDFLYGAGKPFGPPVELPRERMIALHARSLTILHPVRFDPLTITAPLPYFMPRPTSMCRWWKTTRRKGFTTTS